MTFYGNFLSQLKVFILRKFRLSGRNFGPCISNIAQLLSVKDVSKIVCYLAEELVDINKFDRGKHLTPRPEVLIIKFLLINHP
jgi:hypothetical protein